MAGPQAARGIAEAEAVPIEDSSIAQMLALMRAENKSAFDMLGGRIVSQQSSLEAIQRAAVETKTQVMSVASAVSNLQNGANVQNNRLSALEAALTTLQEHNEANTSATTKARDRIEAVKKSDRTDLEEDERPWLE